MRMLLRSFPLLACVGIIAAGCASTRDTSVEPDQPPGQRPEIKGTAAGLWMVMDRAEDKVRGSGRVIDDPALTRYVQAIACKVSPPYCKDLRTYVMRLPHFNASMAPNGFMQVWSGLLLRVENEAQLATVIGHEIGHYRRRHSVRQFESARDTSNALAFLGIALAGVGLGPTADIATLIAYGAFASYGRDQESEADEIGLRTMSGVGYDPREATKIWENLVAETKAGDGPERSILFASHPSPESRIDGLKKEAAKLPPGTRSFLGRDELAAAIKAHRLGWLQDEVGRGKYAETEVLLERLERNRVGNVAQTVFARGELYRARQKDGDVAKAVETYRRAIALEDAPAEAWRGLGLMLRRSGDAVGASEAFKSYLAKAPAAPDRAIIETYVTQ